MSSSSPPNDRPLHRRHFSWTPSLLDAESVIGQEVSQDVGPLSQTGSYTPAHHAGAFHNEHTSTSDLLRSYSSRYPPFPSKSKEEFVMSKEPLTRIEANTESDKVPVSDHRPILRPREHRTDTAAPQIHLNLPSSSLIDTSNIHKYRPPTPTFASLPSKAVRFSTPTEQFDDMLSPTLPSAYAASTSDFRLSTRRHSTHHPVGKLKKRTSIFASKRLSSLPSPTPSTTPLLAPQRSNSSTSSKHLSDHFSFLRVGNKSKSPKNEISADTPASPATIPQLSDLPTDRSALEGRINYHIGRLDRLKKRVNDLNVAITQERREYNVLAGNLRKQGMVAAVADLAREVEWVVQCRDGLKRSVAFHRGELERIAMKRVWMDERRVLSSVCRRFMGGWMMMRCGRRGLRRRDDISMKYGCGNEMCYREGGNE